MTTKKRQNRMFRLTIRFTDAEMRKILENAEKMKLSAAGYGRYAMLSMLDGRIEKILQSLNNGDTIRQVISGIGNNLNQAMRAVNIANKHGNEEAVKSAVNRLWNVILSVKNEADSIVKELEPEKSKKRVPKEAKQHATE